MTVIVRKDGIRFVINAYHEAVVLKKTSLLKKELHTLANMHGKFASLRYTGQTIEAAFSPDQGYLFGPSIWAHFDRKPDNLIYCEPLPDTQDQILLVIIHNRQFYVSTVLSKSNIISELAALLLLEDKPKFDIYVHGDVPITETTIPGKFSFESSMVSSFHALETPVFPTLEVGWDTELAPIDNAIRRLHLPQNYAPLIAGSIIALVIFGYFYKKMRPKEAAQLAPLIQINYLNPYQGMQDALTSPEPTQIIMQLTDQIDTLLGLPGWTITHVSYDNLLLQADVASTYGKLAWLMRWSTQYKFRLEPLKTGVLLSKNLRLFNRAVGANTGANAALSVYRYTYDTTLKLLPYPALRLAEIKSFNSYKQYHLELTLKGVSTNLLRQIALSFMKQPIVLENANFTITEGLISGKITFSIYGT